MLEIERTSAREAVGTATPTAVASQRVRTLAPAELAWVALVPCALVALAAIVLLGPPLGHLLQRPSGDALWPPGWWEARGQPEPVEHGRFLLAVLAPLLLIAAIAVGARRPLQMRPRAIRAAAYAGQLCLLAFVAFALLVQQNVIEVEQGLSPAFSAGMFAAAAAVAAGAVLLPRSGAVRSWIARVARERMSTRIACAAIAAGFAAAWLLETIQTDRLGEERGLMTWTLNDVFAVLNGLDPLVDYHLIYAKLLPYPTALVLLAFGTTGFVYTLFMAVLSLLALLAVYGILRRLTPSALFALGLFVPFVALSGYRHTMIMAAMWPMRYGGAYLMAWLTARHVDGRRPRHAWPLFLVAGLLLVNELEFGIAALLASAAALLCARPPRDRREALRLAAQAGAGLLVALAAVCALTLARAGALPKPSLLLEWPRVFAELGWFSYPMPAAGVHLAIYATLAGALVAAVVRVLQRADDVLLTSMLAWAGVFGLVAAGYYAGRSDEVKLASMFSTWAFALVLLTILCLRGLASRGWRAPTVPELLVLLGFGLAVAQVSQLISPIQEIDRLTGPAPPLQYRPAAKRFIAQHTTPGQKVAITIPEGHRLAYEVGVENVAPYPNQNAVVTRRQMQRLIDVLARERVQEVFLPVPGAGLLIEIDTAPEQLDLLLSSGYVVGDSAGGIVELRRTGG
ncbi:MAG TPA: hypothetical protein VFS37_09125 [Conexibacter sp.]|nr:hypothetical protein [Conexibacter sp.]